MATFTYTAKRSIKSGHTLDVDYVIDIELMSLDGEMPKPEKKESRSLGGNTVTVLHRIDTEISVTTDYIESDGSGTPDTDDFSEFFNSVAGGEQFTFNNGSDQTCEMVSMPTRTRTGIKFNYSFSFRVIE